MVDGGRTSTLPSPRAVIPVVGLVPRIAVEEAELVRVLGDQYRSYQKATRRLVPGLW